MLRTVNWTGAATQEYSLAWSLMKEMPIMRPYLFSPDTAVSMFIGRAAAVPCTTLFCPSK